MLYPEDTEHFCTQAFVPFLPHTSQFPSLAVFITGRNLSLTQLQGSCASSNCRYCLVVHIAKFRTNMAERHGDLLLWEILCSAQECDPVAEGNPPRYFPSSTRRFQSICHTWDHTCVRAVKWRAWFNMLELISCCSLRYLWCVSSKKSSSELHFFLPLQ